jgi:hypothetical protein
MWKRGISKIPADLREPPTRLVEGKSPMFEAVEAPASGMLIVRQNADSTGRDIVSTSLDAKAPLTPLAAGPFQERSPAVSPDGRYLAFASDESGRDEVYVQPLEGTGRVPVSAGGGSEPRWAPTGKEIYYWSRDTLYAAPVATSPSLAVGSRRFVLTGHYAREPFHANYDVRRMGRASCWFVRCSRVMREDFMWCSTGSRRDGRRNRSSGKPIDASTRVEGQYHRACSLAHSAPSLLLYVHATG